MQIFDRTETILFVIISPWGCTEFPENSMFRETLEYSRFFRCVATLTKFSFSTCSRREPLVQVTEVFSSHQTGSVKALQLSSLLQTSGVHHPFFIQDRTSDRRGVVPFTLAVWSQYIIIFIHLNYVTNSVHKALKALRRVRRSLDDECVKTLVHRCFVTAPVVTWYYQLTEVCDRQTTTGAERRRMSRQCHAQVRPWTVTDSTCRLALARCGRSGLVQAWCYSPPMSPQQSAAVSGRLLRSSLRHRQ